MKKSTKKGLSKFRVFSNAIEVVDAFNGKVDRSINSLVLDNLNFVDHFGCVSFSHIPRILNGAAHMVANAGKSCVGDVV